MSSQNLLSGLNPAQTEAVLHKTGPLLIVAGAGSGKTRVLTHRVAHLIAGGVAPEKILAVTFTNKAAGEMRERVTKLLPSHSPQNNSSRSPDLNPWIGTFHSLGAWILRKEAGEIGFKKDFSILDEEDSLSIVKEIVKGFRLDPKQFHPSRLKKVISAKKCDLADADDFESEASDYFSKNLALVWSSYEARLKSSNSMDFDDLLVKTCSLFSNRQDVLEKYQNLWSHVLIDEYQDTDFVQCRIANLLASRHKNISVVGDIDQSIYSFRGADFRNILNFEAVYPGAKIITLEENYRSTDPVLKAANAVIARNELRKPKNLFTQKTGGEKLALYGAENETDEADFIAERTRELIKGGANPSEVAVLFRTNAQSRVLEEKFIEKNIPHYVVGVKFYNRKEVKDILSYLRTALNSDDLISKKRIINLPPRGIGKATLAKYLLRTGLNATEAKKISSFENVIAKIKEHSLKGPASRAVSAAIKESEYVDIFNPAEEDGMMRLANIKELVSLATKFDGYKPPEGILKLLEEAALMSEQDSIGARKNGAPLTTVHAAKGLEFDYVFVSGLEDGLFPHTAFGAQNEKLRLEEERRLFYVALTRARKKVFLSMAFVRMIFGEKQANMPSRFLGEIPPELIEPAEKEGIIEV